MRAYELLAKLRYLTLVGYEDGEYVWVGTNKKWEMAEWEEECILRDWEEKLIKK